MSYSQRENNEQNLPPQFFDTERVINNAADYQRDGANDILIHIPEDTEGFTAFTSFDITLKNLSTSCKPVDLLECWIDWPPTLKAREILGAEHPDMLPMIIRDLDVPKGIKIALDTDKEKTTLHATSISSSTIRIKFKVPNVFFNLPGRPPFARKRLTVNIKVLNGATSSVVHLEYPSSIAMRTRLDNAEYQSLVLSIGDNYYRKATFFPQKVIRIRYTFGTTNGTELSAPGFPPLRAGLAFLGFGFTLLLIEAGHANEGLFHLAAVTFALSLIPSFVEMFRIRSLFSHSAAVADKASWERVSTVLSGTFHVLALVIVALILFLLPSSAFLVPGIVLSSVGGILVLGAGALYFLPLTLGAYQKYTCDTCERRTWIRKWLPMGLGTALYQMRLGTKLHSGTRHSLCVRCYDDVSKEHLEYRPLPQGAFPRTDDGHQSIEDTAGLASEPGTGSKGCRNSEQERWKNVLAGDVQVGPLPNYVESGVIQNLKDMHLELRFIPSLNLGTIDNDVQEYLKKLEERYPGWQNVRKLYWELVRDGKFGFPELPGQWIAVEVEGKPALGDKYPATPLAAKLGFNNDRLNVSWNSIHDAIERENHSVLSEIGLPAERTTLRLLEALEWNLIANREGWGKTNTWEWTSTKFCGHGHMRVIILGNSALGGARSMSVRSPVSSHDDLGFRAAIILGNEDAND